jgi:hypothetical protein
MHRRTVVIRPTINQIIEHPRNVGLEPKIVIRKIYEGLLIENR